MTTLSPGGERAGRSRTLGSAWGLGHATTLFAFGLPIVLFRAYLPEPAQQGAETAVGLVIVALALSLLVRWHRGAFHTHHHPDQSRTLTAQAYGIGLVHGMGGSAGVGVLLLASIHDRASPSWPSACSPSSPPSRWRCSRPASASRRTRPGQPRLPGARPGARIASLAFGIWYALGALQVAPYYF